MHTLRTEVCQGQLRTDDKRKITVLLDDRFRKQHAAKLEAKAKQFASGSTEVSELADDQFEELLNFVRDHPGKFYRGNKQQHLHVLLAGLIAGKVAVVRRTQMEKFTHAKYLPTQWTRKAALCRELGAKPAREVGAAEISRVRANECPYASDHGMSLAGGGVPEGVIFAKTLTRAHTCDSQISLALAAVIYELSVPIDPTQRLGNWGLHDIEKICNEARVLNPSYAAASQALPGETMHDVGQNPQVGSSIGATQHTQIWSGSLLSYPVWQLSSSGGGGQEAFLGGAKLDVVQVGSEPDAVFLKIMSSDVLTEPVQRFLAEIRLQILSEFGGATQVDFLCKAMSDGSGGHVVILVPIAQLEKQVDTGSFKNNLTGADQNELGLVVHCIDTAKGCGGWMINDASKRQSVMNCGEASLRQLYDFTRIPGLLQFVTKFVDSCKSKTRD